MNFLGVVFWMFLNNIKLIPLSYNISYCRALFRALEHLLEQPNYIPNRRASEDAFGCVTYYLVEAGRGGSKKRVNLA